MDDIVLIGLIGLLGYVLGIIGFFRAGAALKEIRQLRASIAQATARADALQPSVPPAPDPTASTPSSHDAETDATPPMATPAQADPIGDPVAAQDTAAAFPEDPPAIPRARDFESDITLRWAVWLGAVALLFAGVFLIRYAAEQGFFGPGIRCGAAVILGAALLAAAAWLQKRTSVLVEGPAAVDQAPAALAAGGIAILFAAAYGAGPYYNLLSPPLAFVAMAAVSFLGLVAALRFGPLTAAVGIVGSFVAPALVAVPSPSLIGLFGYLALATAAAHAVVRRTAWTWLGWAVTIGGAVWVVAVTANREAPDLWAAAAFVPVSALLGLLLPTEATALEVGRRLAWGHFATIALAAFVLEGVAPGVPGRVALFALAPIAVWKSIVEPRLDRLAWLGALCGLVALWLWNGCDQTNTFYIFPDLPGGRVGDNAEGILWAAFAFAGTFMVTGFVVASQAPHPARWTALVAAVPTLALLLCYGEIGRFEADLVWGFVGLLLAIGLTGLATRATRQGASDQAGTYAAGAVAALALALGMTLHDQWFTASVALILPGLAWIEAKVDLPALRIVAALVAITTFVLLPGWLFFDIVLGHRVVADHPFATYAIPAAAFAMAARVFARRRDDALVATLEAGAMATAAVFVTIETRLWFGNGSITEQLDFDEAATLMLAASAQAVAYDRFARRSGRVIARIARVLFGGVAYAFGVGLIFANPMLEGGSVGFWSLTLAYLVPALLAGWAQRSIQSKLVRPLLLSYAVIAGFVWTTSLVRLHFHPDAMSLMASPVLDAEMWTWSGAWLAYGLSIMALGLRLADRTLRLVALGIVALVCLKVFLLDMAALTGLLRVGSFLGLGLALIGLSVAYRRYLPKASAVDEPKPV